MEEYKLLMVFEEVHGKMTGSCHAMVLYDDQDDCSRPTGVGCIKDGQCAWSNTIEELTFLYVTRDL